MGIFQEVSNWVLGSYKVRTTQATDGAQLQHMRIDQGVGAVENQVSEVNPLRVADTRFLLADNTSGFGIVNTASVLVVPQYQSVRIDEASSTITYIGKALLAEATSAATWQIIKFEIVGTETIKSYPDGDPQYTFVWDDRATYTYN